MSEEDTVGEVFEVTLRSVQVSEPATSLIKKLYHIVDSFFKGKGFASNPGTHFMAVWKMRKKVVFEDVKYLIESMRVEIGDVKYSVRFATLEESLSYQFIFPEDFSGSNILVLGETFVDVSSGDVFIAHSHVLSSAPALAHIKLNSFLDYVNVKKTSFPVVFEPLLEVD
jgi:hypothetical protein